MCLIIFAEAKQNRENTQGYSRINVTTKDPASAGKKSKLEHKQVKKETEPCVRKGKRSLLPCNTL